MTLEEYRIQDIPIGSLIKYYNDWCILVKISKIIDYWCTYLVYNISDMCIVESMDKKTGEYIDYYVYDNEKKIYIWNCINYREF